MTGTNQIDHISYRNESAYLYKDFGAGHFTNFEHLIQTKKNSGQDTSLNHFNMLANAIGDFQTLKNANEVIISVSWYERFTISFDGLRITEAHGGAELSDNCTPNLSDGTDYYLTTTRTGTTLTCKIYTDASRTMLHDTLSLTIQSDAFQYVYGTCTQNTGNNLNQNVTHKDLDLQETPAPTGNIKIPNYFNSDFVIQ